MKFRHTMAQGVERKENRARNTKPFSMLCLLSRNKKKMRRRRSGYRNAVRSCYDTRRRPERNDNRKEVVQVKGVRRVIKKNQSVRVGPQIS